MIAPRQKIDFCVGVLYLVVGGTCAVIAKGYSLGTPAQMGAGFFPFWLGIGLALLGLGAIVSAWSRQRERQALGTWPLSGLGWILLGIALFALLLKSAGLILATVVLVLISSRASHEFRWRASLISAVAISAFCALVFVGGLSLPMPLWPSF
ncbi:tripartite tricarboxylate transporter TctB family protein [Pseudomonas caspiana]|uniref:tripartite tricarboxylate transporter TctB family protein n=1 Tax=Pseudomonas caspiana TaxID=1451454 RepID=UPI0032F04212